MYRAESLSGVTPTKLATTIDAWFEANPGIHVLDVSYLTETDGRYAAIIIYKQ